MPYNVYKLIHFLGIFALLITIAVSCVHMLKSGAPPDRAVRRKLAMVHGTASFLILLGGFGMLARLGIVQGGLPAWILIKLAIWLLLGFSLMAVHLGTRPARLLLVTAPLVTVLAAAVALYKPF